MFSAMFLFLWKTGELCFAYGESLFSGLAFFSLVAVSCISVMMTFFTVIGGGVAMGVRHVVKKEQERLRGGGPQRRVRPHQD